ncbi:MAG: septation protein IspZ [Moraxella sp.]|nr:septation protein IspZ [Moraxella sp.]
MKALLDYIPLIVFFVLYKTTDPKDSNHPLLQLVGSAGVENNHILVATAGLLITTLIVYIGLFVFQKFRLEKMQWFVVIMTVVFGGVTLALSDDYYIRMKAVLINLGFGAGILIAPLFMQNKEPIVKKLFASVLELSHQDWQRLNIAWAGLFFLLAGLHAFFAFVFMSGKYWGEFTAFGDIIVMITFVFGMFFILRKNFKSSE